MASPVKTPASNIDIQKNNFAARYRSEIYYSITSSLLRYLVDQGQNQNPNRKFVILGSASRDLIRQSSESLAGRIAYYYLGGFRLHDIGPENMKTLWLRGGLPTSFLSASDEESYLWRNQYVTTFLERNIPQLGITTRARTLRRFWLMLCHYHGQILNYAELERSFGVSDMTIRKYCHGHG